MKKPGCIAALALGLAAIAPQSASARYICEIKPTRDGFVALRDGPGPAHKMIARMNRGESVGLLHPPDYEGIVRRGNWLKVTWQSGRMFATPNKKAATPEHTGWVNDGLIDCPE